jgi:hypothetical protein
MDNMRVVMNSLLSKLSMPHTKFYSIPDIFTFSSDRSCCLDVIAPRLKVYKRGNNIQMAINFFLELRIEKESSQ